MSDEPNPNPPTPDPMPILVVRIYRVPNAGGAVFAKNEMPCGALTTAEVEHCNAALVATVFHGLATIYRSMGLSEADCAERIERVFDAGLQPLSDQSRITARTIDGRSSRGGSPE